MRTTLLHIDAVSPDPENPNCRLALTGIDELAASILAAGQLEPIGVRPDPASGGDYLIVYGHRRHAAIRKIAASKSPGHERLQHIAAVIIRGDLSRLGISQLRLIENVHTQKMTPVEIALELARCKREKMVTNAQLAALTGMSESSISRYLIINDLDPSTIRLIQSGRIRWTEAVDAARQVRIARRGFTPEGRQAARDRKITVAPVIMSNDHPLAPQAIRRCVTAGHLLPPSATSCIDCFEATIRADERRSVKDEILTPLISKATERATERISGSATSPNGRG